MSIPQGRLFNEHHDFDSFVILTNKAFGLVIVDTGATLLFTLWGT